jgi:hypothetical protein
MATMTLSFRSKMNYSSALRPHNKLWPFSRSSDHSIGTNVCGFSVGSQGPQKTKQNAHETGFSRLITIAVFAGALALTIAWVALFVYGLFWLATTVF